MTLNRLSLFSLGLGALLFAPAVPAQKAAGLAPKGTFVAIRVSSLGWLEKANSFLAKTLGEDSEAMEIPGLKDYHDLGGVDKSKPVYVFLAGSLQNPPWVALPMADAGAFEKGMKLPGKPLVQGSYGLLNPTSVMGGEAPALGEPALGDLPEKNLSLRILGPQALAAFGPNLMQIQMMISMMARMSAQGDPKKAQALGQGVDYAFNLLKNIQRLDLGFNLSDTGAAQASLSALPKGGSSLEGLFKAFKPVPAPPAPPLANPLFRFTSAFPPAKAFPKEILGLFQALSSKATAAPATKDPTAAALTSAGSAAVALTPEGKIVLAFVQKVTDPKAVKPLLSSKEKLAGLVDKMTPALLKSGEGGEALSMIVNLIKEADFQPGAFEVDGNPVTGISIPLGQFFKGAGADQKAAFQKLLGGDSLHGLASVMGNQVVVGFGPENYIQKLFANFGSAAALPANTLAAGSFRLGSAANLAGKILGKEVPKDVKLSGLPPAEIRFSLKNDGKQVKGSLAGNLGDLLRVIKVLKKLN